MQIFTWNFWKQQQSLRKLTIICTDHGICAKIYATKNTPKWCYVLLPWHLVYLPMHGLAPATVGNHCYIYFTCTPTLRYALIYTQMYVLYKFGCMSMHKGACKILNFFKGCTMIHTKICPNKTSPIEYCLYYFSWIHKCMKQDTTGSCITSHIHHANDMAWRGY